MPHGDALLGIAAAAAAAACFDGAVLLQAREARTIPAAHGLRPSLLRRLLARPLWVLGTVLAILGWPLQLAAFALAPVTVVQPTLALGTLLVLAGGARILGERVGPREWAAAAAVVAGVVALAVGAPERSDRVPSAATAIPLAGLAAVVALPYLAGARRATAWLLIGGAGCAFALTALGGKLLTVELAAGRPWEALGMAAVTVAAAGAGFLTDMTALQRYDATRTAPPMFVLETAIPVALAPLMFGERWAGTPAGGALAAAGLALVLAGGALLGASRSVAGLGEGDDVVGGGRPRSVRQVRTPR